MTSGDAITYYDKDGKTYWSCGCVSYAKMLKGQKVLAHEACNQEHCPVMRELHKVSGEKEKPVMHYRAEDEIGWDPE